MLRLLFGECKKALEILHGFFEFPKVSLPGRKIAMTFQERKGESLATG
jgi:hypothetical protein